MMKNTDLRWSKRGSPLGLPTLKKNVFLCNEIELKRFKYFLFE